MVSQQHKVLKGFKFISYWGTKIIQYHLIKDFLSLIHFYEDDDDDDDDDDELFLWYG